MPSKRKPAKMSSVIAQDTAYNRSPYQDGENDYERSSRYARAYSELAEKGRTSKGKFISKADRNRAAYISRQIRKNSSLRGNDYQYGTREQVAAQHNSRYRNIRRAFGMSAG